MWRGVVFGTVELTLHFEQSCLLFLGLRCVQQAKLELGGSGATCSRSASCPCHRCTGCHSLSWVPDLQRSRALSGLPLGWGRAEGQP